MLHVAPRQSKEGSTNTARSHHASARITHTARSHHASARITKNRKEGPDLAIGRKGLI
jgi:hypothetical protein